MNEQADRCTNLASRQRTRRWQQVPLPQTAVVLALAATCLLTVVALTWGAADEGISSVSSRFTPRSVPRHDFQPGALRVHPQMSVVPGHVQFLDRLQIALDDDIRLDPSATPKCSLSSLANPNATPACELGAGRATVGGYPTPVAHGCAFLYNGKPQGGEPTLFLGLAWYSVPPSAIKCSDPPYRGTSAILTGALERARGDFGQRIDFGQIAHVVGLYGADHHGASRARRDKFYAEPLTDLHLRFRSGDFATARCHDADQRWNVKARFTYTQYPYSKPAPVSEVDDVTTSQRCRVS